MPRLAIQDMKSSLSFNGTSTKIVSPANIQTSTTAFTFATWINLQSATSFREIANTYNGTGGFRIETTADNKYAFNVYNGAASSSFAPSAAVQRLNTWQHLIFTLNSGVVTIYINFVSVATASGRVMTTNANALSIGSTVAGGQYITANMKQTFFIDGYALTGTDIANLATGTAPSNATFLYELNEGAGTVAYDSSGNGNNGTITSGTYVLDTPTKKRKQVNGNLVYNGDFEYAPVVNVATTTASRWADGTSGGSTTNNLFGWAITNKIGSGSIQIDGGKLKISTTATGSLIEAGHATNDFTASVIRSSMIPVLPSTSYTVTYKMSTNYVSGDSNDGAFAKVFEFTGAGSQSTQTSGTKVKTTTSETSYSITLTTGATTRFLLVSGIITGNTGTATLIMDAWFDDIKLTPTTPTTRTAITGPFRQPVNNMVRNGDFEYAPAFTAAQTTAGNWIDGTATGGSIGTNYVAPSRWLFASSSSNSSCRFDSSVKYSGNNSLKLSNLTAGGVSSAVGASTGTISSTRASAIEALPSTSYTLKGYIKTSNVADNSAFLSVLEYDGANTNVFVNTSTKLSGTNDWTPITLTFTTTGTTRFLAVVLRNNVAGNISDAWFDNIKLDLTSNTTRTVVV